MIVVMRMPVVGGLVVDWSVGRFIFLSEDHYFFDAVLENELTKLIGGLFPKLLQL